MRGVIADRVSLVGVGQAGQDVPRRGDGQEQQQPGQRLQCAPAAPLSAQQQQRDRGREEEHRSDQALGQQGQRQRRPHAVEADGPPALETRDEAVQRKKKKERKQRFGNGEARKQERPDSGENPQRRVESGALAPRAPRPQPGQPRDAENGQRIRQPRRERVFAEHASRTPP